jgi:predicted HNH restriction endonuclease
MAPDHPKLVRASPTTRTWLQSLRERIPRLDYSEAKYWAAFKAGTSGAVAQLNPSQGSIRLFLPLDSSSEQDLKPTPSTGTWAKRFRSVFDIASEKDLARAGKLILLAAATLPLITKDSFTRRSDHLSAEEVEAGTEYLEGALRQVTVNAYERNPEAREACLRRYGRSCVICGFNFLRTYGAEAADYIQVHHIKPIARAGGAYALNPIKDLRPVCPNCHAVIHRRDPPFEIAEVKRMLRRSVVQCQRL